MGQVLSSWESGEIEEIKGNVLQKSKMNDFQSLAPKNSKSVKGEKKIK